jgi:oligoendopeptidase F
MKKILLNPKTIVMMLALSFGMCANAQDKNIPDFANTERSAVPKEYKWKMEDIYANTSLWKSDLAKVKIQGAKIEGMSKTWTASATNMLNLLNLVNDISLTGEKLYSYASNQSNMDLGNTEFISLKGEIENFFVQFGASLSFIESDVLALGEAKFNEYLKAEPRLDIYKFGMQKTFRNKDHILPADQQKIVSLTGLFSGAASDAYGVLANVEMPHAEVTLSDGSKTTLNVANYMRYRGAKVQADRSLVMRTFWENQKKFENTNAALLNGEIKSHWFSAQVGKYSSCLEARMFPNAIDQSVYTELIKAVHDHLGSLQRFLTLKKKMLGLNNYSYDDIYASAVKSVTKTYTYDEAKQIILKTLEPMGKGYTDIIQKAFNEGWIDIYPNKGKESGAYSSGLYGVHPFIKMNYNGNYNALTTLIHELGHTMHSYYSDKTQPYSTSQYETFLAEIASTFNENLLMQYILKTETDDLFKIYILDQYLDNARATIFRQTLFAEFELAMHQRVESGQSLTAEWLDQQYLDLTKKYYGEDKGVMKVPDYIQNEWSYISHFYMNYYVYQYSTGLIASMALSEMVLNGKETERDRYIGMLSSGGKDYPLNLLKAAGVDMTKPEAYNAAFANFDKLVAQMETLYNKLDKEGKFNK